MIKVRGDAHVDMDQDLLQRKRETTMARMTTIAKAAGSAGAAAALLFGTSAPASAAEVAGFGSTQDLWDGAVESAYTVSAPTPSEDVVNVPIVGRLYEAETTVEAVHGTVTPAIPFFNARTDSGENYRVLWQAFAPQGLSGATLAQGGKSTGKIYFDVTGPAPTSVVYNDAVQDRLVWQ